MATTYKYPNGYTIRRETVVSSERWRMERYGRLIAHYRTKREAELHGPKLDPKRVPWLGPPIRRR